MLALLKIVIIFAAVIAMIRVKVPLGVAFVLGSLGAALAFGLGVGGTIREAWAYSVEPATLSFVALIGLVVTLSLILKATGRIERITESLRRIVPRQRFLTAALPAIVGLLPMPGGALFSAPMVEAACGGESVHADTLVSVNHWFRHIWEYTWPLYPGLILMADFLDVQVGSLCLAMSPLTLVALAAGAVFLLRGIPKAPPGDAPPPSPSLRAVGVFALEMAPFLLVVATHMAFGISLHLALGGGIAWAVAAGLIRKTGVRPILKAVFWSPKLYGLLVMALGVKLFGGMLDVSGALGELGAFLSQGGIPLLLLAVVLPFVIGFIAGISIVYVTTAFPILLALPVVAQDPIPILIVAYAAGFAGVLISPIHACLVLGNEYFKGSLFRNMARLALPAAVVLAGGVLLYLLYAQWNPLS